MVEHAGRPLPTPGPKRAQQEFAARLKALRKATGLSQRDMGAMLRLNHSTISAYEKPDGRIPDLEYVDKLLAEVGRHSNVTPEVLKDTRDAYGRLLRELCAGQGDPGRTHQYRQMLRIYELTIELERLMDELGDVRARRQQLEAELERLRETAIAPDRQRELQAAVMQLDRRSTELVRSRNTVLSHLDASRKAAQSAPGNRIVPVPAGGGPHQPLSGMSHPRDTGPQTATVAIVAAAVVTTLLGSLLIYRLTDSDTADKAAPHASASASPNLPPPSSPRPESSTPKPVPSNKAPSTPERPISHNLVALEAEDGSHDMVPGEWRLAGRDYPNSLSAGCGLSDSVVITEYALRGEYERFTATLGIVTEPHDADAVGTFRIRIDGKLINSWTVTRSKPVSVDIKISNVEILTLEAVDIVGDPFYCKVDRFIWGDPKVSKKV
ncbi:hypothetical protein GCM10027168_44030 [Streptomyces capparidis]